MKFILFLLLTVNLFASVGPIGGSPNWKPAVATSASLPSSGNTASDARIALDSNIIYVWSGSAWVVSGVAAGSPGTWGSIAGTLSAQSDLQSALNAKQNTITTGTTLQYLRGDLSLATLNTAVVPESGNLYYTDSRARAAFSATAPVALSGGGVISMPAASGSQNGYLSSTDWTTFNSKQSAISTGTTLQYLRGDLSLATLNTSVVPEGSNLYFTNSRATSGVLAGPVNTANNVVVLNGSAQLPAVDGSLLTGINFFTNSTVSTTNGTATTIATVAMSDTSTYTCQAVVSGFQTNAQGTGHWQVFGSAYRNGGACVFENSTKTYEVRSDVNFSADWSCSSNSLLLKVTGNTSKNINWKASVFCTQGT